MRLLLLILLLPFISNAQIINASQPYRVRTAACSYLLDQYSGAAAAYSLRKLDCDYTGNVIRVRRSLDNAESNIGFVNGYLDTATLKTFVGTGGTDDGFVTTWYDQSGNTANMTQATGANQPKIMDNGVILRNSIGDVGIYYPGTAGIALKNTPLSQKAVLDVYYYSDMSDNTYIDFWSGGGGDFSYVADNGSGSTTLYANFGTPSLYTNGSLFGGTTRGQVYTAKNGAKIVTMQGASTSAWTFSEFSMGGYGGFEPTGYYSELIGWTTSQSANRTGITSNINTFYTVY